MDGILVVDKPKDLTSHDVVDLIRRKFGLKKVGHAGTLDPMATGVLVILIGLYTKRSAEITGGEKEYAGEMFLGAVSDTLDACGRIKPTDRPLPADRGVIEKASSAFTGEIEQIPPAYSAVKYKGRKLYELARKGVDIPRRPRKVRVYDFNILDVDLPRVNFCVTCSKGTYVRQLVSDLGEKLGCGAYLSRLSRTRSGRFRLEEALKLSEVERMPPKEIEKRLKYID